MFSINLKFFSIPLYEACSEIIKTLAFYPEHIDLDKQNSALIIIGLL